MKRRKSFILVNNLCSFVPLFVLLSIKYLTVIFAKELLDKDGKVDGDAVNLVLSVIIVAMAIVVLLIATFIIKLKTFKSRTKEDVAVWDGQNIRDLVPKRTLSIDFLLTTALPLLAFDLSKISDIITLISILLTLLFLYQKYQFSAFNILLEYKYRIYAGANLHNKEILIIVKKDEIADRNIATGGNLENVTVYAIDDSTYILI